MVINILIYLHTVETYNTCIEFVTAMVYEYYEWQGEMMTQSKYILTFKPMIWIS